jgi:TonB-linked SusC/RagA family outer membrane protein
MKKTILLFLALLSLPAAYAQQGVIIRGRIIDKADNSTIIGANIIEYDKDNRIINGTVTNVNGDFILEMKDRNNVVKVSVIGYETQEIDVDPSKPITVKLETTSLDIEEVTVTAQAKSSSTLINVDDRDNATSTVKLDLVDMQDAGVISMTDALQGKVSGLDIISASGDPGSGSQLVIRGLSSMGNNKPLIVLDGIPQFNTPEGFSLSSADQEDIGNLVNIPVQDIKSIEILKDAASTAIYGSRGADGVLLIETHKGRMGKVQFDYQYKGSVNIQPPAIPMLNGDEYIMLQLEEWHNAQGVFDIPPEIAYDRDYPDFYNYSANTDWISTITRTAYTHDHYFKISGGGEKATYFTSFSYINEGGTTISTGAKRFSTRVNLDYHLSNKFLFTIQFNYNKNNIDGNLELDDGSGIHKRNIREMSIWEYDSKGQPTGEYFTPINSYQGSGSIYYNPVAVANLGRDDRIENDLQNTFRLRYTILPWLIFRQTVAFSFGGSKAQNYLPYNALGTDWLAWTVNKAEESNNNNSSIHTETQISFNSPFKTERHVLSGAATFISSQSRYEWMNIQSNKIPSTDIRDPSIDGQINWIGTGSGESREIGLLVNLNYKYLDRYMLQTTFRTDAASSFGVNNRWGSFPGISAAWRFSDEPFMKSVQWLGSSMLRASWGISGRQPGDAYARYATYVTAGNGSYMTFPAIVPSQIQLSNLQWESVSSVDVGMELNLFNNRLYIEGDVYQKVTNDLLFKDYDIPRSSGFNQLKYLNGGQLENKGWELMSDYNVIRREKIWVGLNFNISRNVNSFNRLPENFNTERSTAIGNEDYPLRVVEGEPIGSFFGFHYLGVYPSDKDVIARDANGNILYDSKGIPLPLTYTDQYTFKGGDAIYEDMNHDGKIDLNDVVYIGDSNPDFIGGFGATVKYWNIDVSCNFQYRLGFDIINKVAMQTEGMLNRNNQSKATLSRWRVQGQDEAGMLPRAYLNHPANNLGSDRYVEQGDFLRLINFVVAYELKPEICRKLRLRRLSVALSGRKLFTWTRYSGQDPEVGQDASDPFWIGVDQAKTPPPRILTLSISAGF